MEILDGKKVKKELLKELKHNLELLQEKLSLVVIQVGDNEASNIYVNQKSKMALEVGLNFRHIKLNENIKEEELLELIDELNNSKDVTGIMVQMPLTERIDAKKIQNAILPEKDVDGLTDMNMGKLAHNDESALVACTANGVMNILDYYGIDVKGQNVVIVGRSDLVGKPLQALMLNKDATVTVCHSKTKDLKNYTSKADILVVAIGKANYIKNDDVKDGAVIVDVGINRIDGKIYGDVDFESVKDKVSYITPVPGGVGQMTVASLGQNTYKAHMLKKDLK